MRTKLLPIQVSVFFIVMSLFVASCTKAEETNSDTTEKPEFNYRPTDHVLPVYLADHFIEGGKSFIHFRWRPDFQGYSHAVVLSGDNRVLAEVRYPNDKVEVPVSAGKVRVVAVAKGDRQAYGAEVDMNRSYDDLLCSHQEPLRIRPDGEGGKAGFFLSESNEEIILRGVNYCRITYRDHDTFEPDHGPIKGAYDPYDAETMFRLVKKHGYNYVRVFIGMGNPAGNLYGISGPAKTQGIWSVYMDNFVDFLGRAQKYGIYVLPCFARNTMLTNDYFKNKAQGANGQTVLFYQSGIDAKKEYTTLFLQYIKDKNPELLNAMAGLTMENEFHFRSNGAPFNKFSGYFHSNCTGKDYDLSSDKERRELALDAMANYYHELKAAVESVAPGLPVGEGTFALAAVGKTYENSYGIRPIDGLNEYRFPMTGLELLKTDIDFLDQHIYRPLHFLPKGSTGQAVVDFDVKNMLLDTPEAQEILKRKPVILGEFGSFNDSERSIDYAIPYVQQIIDAALDFGFKGTCYWTFDCFEQDRIWNLSWYDYRMLKELTYKNRK